MRCIGMPVSPCADIKRCAGHSLVVRAENILLNLLGACRDGILEYYWGEHIHLGYYTEAERAQGYKKKDFKQAKLDFVDEMLRWSGAAAPARILDVGCGIGGTSRHLAATFPGARVQGGAPPFLTDIMGSINRSLPQANLRWPAGFGRVPDV